MTEGANTQEDRTEAPTQRRLQRAREAGQVAVSREVVLWAVLGAATLGLAWRAPAAGRDLVVTFRALIEHAASGEASPSAALRLAAAAGLRATAPLLALVLVAGAGAVLGQTGFLFSPATLRPDMARISPVAGLRRLLGPDSLIEAGRSLAKLLLIGIAVWHALAADMPALAEAPFQNVAGLAGRLAGMVARLLVSVLVAQAGIAVLDLAWVRFRHARGLRMSREDIREEQKETDGDPRVKARLKRLRLQRARRRMLAAVPKATVVVTNPTHYAVALAYERTQNAAPRVVAKGVDSMAERIREVAREHAVPLVPNPPLARALYRLDLDAEVPSEHYKAVAEIIAFVWRLRGRAA
ncbi:MAG TPA: EscU/YscU/HrcU family type III secretion system export apparatus switch protein [Acetobacteraceae bacterium]|nr:EscU/YscU/HrcU family type III secretion system export apparatus switch protein [Acetobacteraceae bacterium]